MHICAVRITTCAVYHMFTSNASDTIPFEHNVCSVVVNMHVQHVSTCDTQSRGREGKTAFGSAGGIVR